jgi:hypothetical protein
MIAHDWKRLVTRHAADRVPCTSLIFRCTSPKPLSNKAGRTVVMTPDGPAQTIRKGTPMAQANDTDTTASGDVITLRPGAKPPRQSRRKDPTAALRSKRYRRNHRPDGVTVVGQPAAPTVTAPVPGAEIPHAESRMKSTPATRLAVMHRECRSCATAVASPLPP